MTTTPDARPVSEERLAELIGDVGAVADLVDGHWREVHSALRELQSLRAEVESARARIASLEKDAGKLPKEPPMGLLMSMAIRYDHGLGIPGFYEAPYMGNPVGFHARKLEATLRTMHQLYEEVSGHGFWSPENDCEYVAAIDAASREKQT